MKKSFSRRHFIKTAAITATGLAFIPRGSKAGQNSIAANPVRLGGPVPGNFTDPVERVKAVKSLKYSATYCPVHPGVPVELIRSFRAEAKKSNIVIAEVGAWSNTLDPVNMISSPQKYFNNAAFLKECFAKLGPYLKSIHAKDITIMSQLTVHLEERRPGLGSLDYGVFLQETSRLRDIPFMMEHLGKQEDYKLAAAYIREVDKKAGIMFVE